MRERQRVYKREGVCLIERGCVCEREGVCGRERECVCEREGTSAESLLLWKRPLEHLRSFKG